MAGAPVTDWEEMYNLATATSPSAAPSKARYRGDKGNLRIPPIEPIPYSLVTCVAVAVREPHGAGGSGR